MSRSPTPLTRAQCRALRFLASVPFATPAEIGQAMGGTRTGKAQGLGRMGGAMAARLAGMGLVASATWRRGGFPAYSLTMAGRKMIEND